jgi:hypothetical protein
MEQDQAGDLCQLSILVVLGAGECGPMRGHNRCFSFPQIGGSSKLTTSGPRRGRISQVAQV